jgi:hypothetical protein
MYVLWASMYVFHAPQYNARRFTAGLEGLRRVEAPVRHLGNFSLGRLARVLVRGVLFCVP